MSLDDDAIPKTISVHVHAERVAALNRAAIRISFETGRSIALKPSQLAQYVLDNYLDEAVERLLAESKKT
ncbi:hypothetical protein [Pseudomonas sp. DC3000-4b1]|uniref:hypothetical protein n=1 Tax=unclassified Pseudomonas TaxID=196821 RepID=UPI003CE86897